MKKFFSVVLLVVGLLSLYAAVLNVVVRLADGSSPEYGVVAVLFVLGALLTWRGALLWDRWRMTTGVVCLVFGASALGNMAGFLRGGSKLDPGMVENLSAAFLVIAVVWLVAGTLFIVADVKRKRAKPQAESEAVDS